MSERALKERIIGAAVLVAFVVLVVPVFLDGPAVEEEFVSETVMLPGQNNQERRQQTIVLDRNRSEAVPAARQQVQSLPENRRVAVEEAPATNGDETSTESGGDDDSVTEAPDKQPELAATQAQEPAADEEIEEEQPSPAFQQAEQISSTGMWAVQLGSFSNQENADRLASDLRSAGYAAFLSRLQTGTGSLHRVRVGPQKDRATAESVAEQLQKSGHTGQVVPHP